jgi:hypothetical protein
MWNFLTLGMLLIPNLQITGQYMMQQGLGAIPQQMPNNMMHMMYVSLAFSQLPFTFEGFPHDWFLISILICAG